MPALASTNAAVAPQVVVSDEVAERRSVPVVLVRLTPPVPEPVTVMASNVLVPMLVPVAASRAWRAGWS